MENENRLKEILLDELLRRNFDRKTRRAIKRKLKKEKTKAEQEQNEISEL